MGQKEINWDMRSGQRIATFFAAAALAASAFGAQTPTVNPNLEKDVRHAINFLAYYGVFDNLGFNISDDGVVTLTGQVVQYYVHNSAISAVRNLPGVTRVVDQIEVLPLSPFDNDIRIRAYNAIFGYPALNRYVVNSRPPIRIIVRRGTVTLEGVVNNELDRNLVYNRIRSLPGALTVTNDLRLD